MTLVEEGRIGLDQRVCAVLPEFVGARTITPYPDPLKPGAFVEVVPASHTHADAGKVTFRHLLAHNSGLPAWLPLWQIGQSQGLPLQESHDKMCATALTCAFAYPTGARVVYSDIGLILLGFAMEKITGKPLNEIVRERVTAPPGLSSVCYGPLVCHNVAPTEFYAHQGKRMCGEVHDENAWGLGGVAGHAGVFGTARDVATLGEMFRRSGAPLLHSTTLAEMKRLQAQDGAVRRGLGFALWSPDPAAASNPLSERALGHTGFTGTSLYVDPLRDLVVACLTNRVYYGRDNADALGAFRVALHRTVCQILDRRPPTADRSN